jgi:hypothetical protein
MEVLHEQARVIDFLKEENERLRRQLEEFQKNERI